MAKERMNRMQKGRRTAEGFFLFSVLCCLLFALGGCKRDGAAPRENPEERTGTDETTKDTVETQAGVQLGTGAPAEAVTEEMTETLTEAVTEEPDFRNIREVLDEETLLWVQQFSDKKVRKLVYTIHGEAQEVYTVTDPEQIRAFYEALMEVEVAGLAQVYAEEAGDSFVFYEDSDQEEAARFDFHMGCLMLGEEKFETDHADHLWELTGRLMFPEEMETL